MKSRESEWEQLTQVLIERTYHVDSTRAEQFRRAAWAGTHRVRDVYSGDSGEYDDQHNFEQRIVEFTSLLRSIINELKMQVEISKSTDLQSEETVGKVTDRIFIGHGHAKDWLELHHFLKERLGLECEEFNSEAVAGIATKERLEDLLSKATFAFIVATAEDQTTQGEQRARENVVHEIGLFQGRLGFRKAIVVLEDGCGEFSNIHGLGQIRFPKGAISSKFEEIRKTLEREGVIAAGRATTRPDRDYGGE